MNDEVTSTNCYQKDGRVVYRRGKKILALVEPFGPFIQHHFLFCSFMLQVKITFIPLEKILSWPIIRTTY